MIWQLSCFWDILKKKNYSIIIKGAMLQEADQSNYLNTNKIVSLDLNVKELSKLNKRKQNQLTK